MTNSARFRASVLGAACLGAALLLACREEQPPAEPPAEGEETAAPAQPKAAAPGQGVQIKVGDDFEFPAEFPEDIPVYPGAKAKASASGTGTRLTVGFESSAEPKEVFDFYRETLEGGGWSVDNQADMGAAHMLMVSKAGRTATILIAKLGETTQIGVTLGSAD